MTLPIKFWKFPSEGPAIENQVHALQEAGMEYSPAFLRLCLYRGLDSPEKILAATDPEPQLFHDPYLLYNMDRLVQLVGQAIEAGDPILVYGDYDADGITSTLILYEALEQLGARVEYYLPNRLIDGYGPNIARYQEFIEQGIRLILTCDNGIAGFEAIQYAVDQGITVIVTDHHAIQDKLPEAHAIIHPQHPKGTYPFGDLAGAGVALKVAHALLGDIPTEALELAAIGTIADMVSLRDENRTIVKAGLTLMKETSRIGLEKLLVQAVDNIDQVDEETIGFSLGPRLNAIGRLGDPSPALHLLATFDEEEAQHLLELINQKNDERKQIVERISHEVTSVIEAHDQLPPIIILSHQDWPAGVLGIVASKITQTYHRPTILLQTLEEKGIMKGSGRGVEGSHLFEWIASQSHLLQAFGGHSQAAGLTVDQKDFEAFRQGMIQVAHQFGGLEAKPTKTIDLVLSIEEANEILLNEISQLGPFGMDNPKPLLGFRNVHIQQLRKIGTGQQHAKVIFSSQSDLNQAIEGIGFSMADQLDSLKEEPVTVSFQLAMNEWQGKKSIQIRLDEITTESIWLEDLRASRLNPNILTKHNAVVVYQQKRIGDWLASTMGPTNQYLAFDELTSLDLNSVQSLVLMECPPNLEIIQPLFQLTSLDHIVLGLYQQQSKFLAGLPTREEFGKAYRIFGAVLQGLAREQILGSLQKNIGLPLEKIKCILGVFFELKFVTIEDGCVTFVGAKSGEKFDLFSTTAYQKYHAAYLAEELLVYSSPQQIKSYINELRNK